MSHTHRMVLGRMLGFVALAVFVLAGHAAFAAPAQQSTVEVSIQGFKFDPPTLSVVAGTTVNWTNLDTAPHTATSTESGKFDTGELQQGQSKAITLNEVGTFEYFCLVHPNMIATLTVTAESAAQPAAPQPTAAQPATTSLPNTGRSDMTGLLAAFGVLVMLAGLALARSSRRTTLS